MHLCIRQLGCKNIRGIHGDFAINPGQVTVFAGKNGTNKTSSLAVLHALFGKANERMLRNGSSHGHATGVIEDLDSGESYTIRREFEPGRAKARQVTGSRVGRLGAGATFIEGIVNQTSMDPINRAMNASESEQAEILLQIMPLQLPEGALEAAAAPAAVDKKLLAAAAQKKQALDAIKLVYDAIYDQRTDIGRSTREKRAYAKQLRESLGPAGEDVDWRAEVTRFAAELQAAATALGKLKTEAESDYAEFQRSVSVTASTERIAIDADIQAKIDELNRERERRKSEVDDRERIQLRKLEQSHQQNLKDLDEKHAPERDRLTREHAVAQQNADAQTRCATTRQHADEADKVAESGEAKSSELTKALNCLDKLRDGLLDSLPFKGLTFGKEDRLPYLNGVLLSDQNTQTQLDFWVRIAAEIASDLGIVVLDNTEHYDDEHFERLVDAAKKVEGIQWFFGRVDNKPFRVEHR